MTYKEAIEIIRADALYNPECAKMCIDLLRVANEAVAREARRMAWTPIHDCLPGGSGEREYLVCYADGTMIVMDRNEMSHTNGVAWMPLPEPYREERRTDGVDS